MFPEIKYYYGESIQTKLYLDMSVTAGDFLSISKYSGIEIGKNDVALAQLQVFCKNSTLPDYEMAVQFDMDLEAIVNATVDSALKVYLNIPETSVYNVDLTHDKVGMIARHYDNLLSTVVRTAVNNINVKWQRPFDITSLDP